MRYAQIIIDISAESIDRLFTYSIPEGMEPLPGMLAAVSFGPRERHGFILNITNTPPVDIAPERIKPIRRLMDDEYSLLPDQVELAVWMHRHYLCTLSDALKLMVVPGIRTENVRPREIRMYTVPDRGAAERYIQEHPRALKQISELEKLLKGDRSSTETDSAAMKLLNDRGIVRQYTVRSRRVPAQIAPIPAEKDFTLTPAQKRAFDIINDGNDPNRRFLLHGVTGSGKTELYIQTIRRYLSMGKSAIVLVPEISLTPQLAAWFRSRFGDTAAVLHSALSEGERHDEWCRIRNNEARVVIGARSAIFAPVRDLGIIIIDEEHEGSYLSDRRPRYDAREVARKRCDDNGAILILGSATPSVATYMHVLPRVRPENRFTLVELMQRANGKPLPQARIVDMRNEFAMGNTGIFSSALLSEIRSCLSRGDQAMLFLNRRGFSSYISCRSCGQAVKCPNCDITMTYHRSEEKLICHYCGNETAVPVKCPACSSRAIRHFGFGTEKVEEELKQYFPDATVLRMDADTTRTRDAHKKIYDAFRERKAQVLIGTQMIAKGLDFPGVSLVGVISADMSLNLPDYRSCERTFQLIMQASGRAGRADTDGKVIIQAYDPDHYAVRLAALQDYRAFFIKESGYRKLALYPPYTTILRIVYSGESEEAVKAAAEKDEAAVNRFFDEEGMRRDIIQARALEAPVKLLRGEYRWQLFIKMYYKGDAEKAAARLQSMCDAAPDGVRAEFESNPNSLI